jgi:tRNA threonylcarbamoyladenosine biosynthesis protein TsaE
MIEIITKSAKETKKAGFALAKKLKNKPLLKHAFVVALSGNLGSGKTTFTQGFAEGLGIKENILSPTFVIQKDFLITNGVFNNFYHIDAYRLKNPEELLELGFKDLIKNPENLIIIEWADKIKKILPKNIFKMKFVNLEKNKRKITHEEVYSH